MTTAVAERYQTLAEEIANAISHGLGMLAIIVGTPFLLIHAAELGDPGYVVGASLFAATACLLYLSSTLYHCLPAGAAKRVLKDLDHAAIFLLIAGTYSPFTLGILAGPWGWTLFAIVWSTATLGIVLKLLRRLERPLPSTGFYLGMGWLIVIAAIPLVDRLSWAGLGWLAAGGLAYTIGVIFFVTGERVPFGHFVWHLFVLAGTSCHYVAVFLHAI